MKFYLIVGNTKAGVFNRGEEVSDQRGKGGTEYRTHLQQGCASFLQAGQFLTS